MSVYTVYEPPLKAHESAPNPERFVFVRDGFSFWAFLLAPWWMLRHRLWLALTGYVILAIALSVALRFAGASTTVTLIAGALFSLLVGFEAATLRRFKLSRRGWKNVGIVVGDDLESAARRVHPRPQWAWRWRAGRHPRSSACFRNRERRGDRRHRRLRLGQSALGGESVRARRARGRIGAANRGDERSRGGRPRRARGAAGRRRLRRLPAWARCRRRHGGGAQRQRARARPAVPRHLRRHAAHGRTRPRIRGDAGAGLDCGRG